MPAAIFDHGYRHYADPVIWWRCAPYHFSTKNGYSLGKYDPNGNRMRIGRDPRFPVEVMPLDGNAIDLPREIRNSMLWKIEGLHDLFELLIQEGSRIKVRRNHSDVRVMEKMNGCR